MRINQFVARATGLSRRASDAAIQDGRVTINDQPARLGDTLQTNDNVTLDGWPIMPAAKTTTIMLNKPAGYVCSRQGQGSKTIYELLPAKYHHLKPAGRLDKDSSGLLILTDDGELANRLTHPRYAKTKVYEIKLNKPLQPQHQQAINRGVQLEDGLSRLQLKPLDKTGWQWQVTMTEGRNRQIRRTFAALDYAVINLNRLQFGPYSLGSLKRGQARGL